MSKHTQGPWAIGKVNQGTVAGSIPVATPDYMESYRSGQLICSVYGTASFSNANARLIAAAPELLEALRGMLALDEEHHQRGHCDDDVCAEVLKARAAIAKATGEQT